MEHLSFHFHVSVLNFTDVCSKERLALCTIGAVRLKDGAMALFKNKDFSARQFSDRVIMTPQVFGCEGLETFAENDAKMVFSGLSVGANAHGVMATVNHVKITDPTHQNYDRLTELVLKNAHNIDQAIALIEDALKKDAYWWGNLIIADCSGCAVIEVRGQEYHVTKSHDRLFRTNHQPLFGERASPDDLHCSAKRYVASEARLPNVRTLSDLKDMLSAHDDNGTGICNHSVPLTTVYSYILIWRDGALSLHIANGLPCEAPWDVLSPLFGPNYSEHNRAQFLDAYPGLAASSQ